MWEKAKLWGSLENRGGAQKIHGGAISWGLLQRGVPELVLTLPLLSLLVPTPFTKGGGGVVGWTLPCFLKNRCPFNLKFCRVFEKCFNVLEMLKLFP